MISRGQVFVRAQDPSGRWGPADVLDLDETSFRAFVLERMMSYQLVVGLSSPDGDPVTYRTTVPFPPEPDTAPVSDPYERSRPLQG